MGWRFASGRPRIYPWLLSRPGPIPTHQTQPAPSCPPRAPLQAVQALSDLCLCCSAERCAGSALEEACFSPSDQLVHRMWEQWGGVIQRELEVRFSWLLLSIHVCVYAMGGWLGHVCVLVGSVAGDGFWWMRRLQQARSI